MQVNTALARHYGSRAHLDTVLTVSCANAVLERPRRQSRVVDKLKSNFVVMLSRFQKKCGQVNIQDHFPINRIKSFQEQRHVQIFNLARSDESRGRLAAHPDIRESNDGLVTKDNLCPIFSPAGAWPPIRIIRDSNDGLMTEDKRCTLALYPPTIIDFPFMLKACHYMRPSLS